MVAANLRKTGAFYAPRPLPPADVDINNLSALRRCLDPKSTSPLPVRPQGAGSASTDCNRTESGTTLRLSGLDRIIHIDHDTMTVTAQAGVRLETLTRSLAEEGLELIGACDLLGRTVGGAIAAPCFGPSIGDEGGYFSSQVTGMKVVRPDGRPMRIDAHQDKLLSAYRMSFGTLGVIYEATLRVRPIQAFTVSHRRVDIDKFASVVDTLAAGQIGFKFYLMPYRDRVYLDLRRYDAHAGNLYNASWKIKDWGESTILPNIFKSLNRVVPIRSVKYRLIDGLSEATQGLVNSKYVTSGTNAISPSKQYGTSRRCHYSTWCFPAANFSMVVRAYRDFCLETYAASRYRCDMPAAGYRLPRDTAAVLSPSFDEAMIALTTASTQASGWDDFVIDLAEFAEKWSGQPLISQSRSLRAEHVIQTYSRRLDFFRRLRRQLDPENRLLNPYLAQFLQ